MEYLMNLSNEYLMNIHYIYYNKRFLDLLQQIYTSRTCYSQIMQTLSYENTRYTKEYFFSNGLYLLILYLNETI